MVSRAFFQMSTCEPGDEITLLYSSQQVPEHFCIRENSKEHLTNNEGGLSDDHSAKGYNAIFYRTVQYLCMVFQQKRRDNEMKNTGLHSDQVEHQQHEDNSNNANLRHGNVQEVESKIGDFCVRGTHDATMSFKQGELIAIVGKHGAGKTTLLKILSGRLMCGCKQVSLH